GGTVRGGLWLRVAAAVAVVAALVVYALACRAWWVGELDAAFQQAQAAEEEEDDDSTGETEEASPEELAGKEVERYGTGPKREVTTVLKVSRDGGTTRIRATHTFRLPAGDPLLKAVRTKKIDVLAVAMPPLGLADKRCLDTSIDSIDRSVRVVQRAPDAAATVSGAIDPREFDCGPQMNWQLRTESPRGWIGAKGLYDRWTVELDVPGFTIDQVVGVTPRAQSAHRVEFMLPGTGKARVAFASTGDTASPAADDNYSEFTRYLKMDFFREIAAVLGVLVLLLAAERCLQPALRERTDAARWPKAAMVVAAVTAAAVLPGLGPLEPTLFTVDTEVIGRSAEATWGNVHTVWLLVLLPLLALAAGIRFATGRSPKPRQLAPLLVPAVLLFTGPAALAVASDRPGVLWLILLSLPPAVLVGVLLRSGLIGDIGRRWAVTAAAAAWLGYAGTAVATGLPIADHTQWYTSAWELANTGLAAFVIWAWIPALWLLVGRQLTGPRLTLLLIPLLVWYALGGASAFGLVAYLVRSRSGELVSDAGEVPALHPLTSAGLIATEVQLAALAGILLYLRRHGRRPGEWPAEAQPLAVGLGFLAALGHVMVAWPVRGFSSPGYLAVLCAVFGFGLLLPADREAAARRLHRLPETAHNRVMHALLRDLTLETSRHEFHTTSRGELADGSLTPAAWTGRWRQLGALGRRGRAPSRSRRLYRVALGTSAGRPAWENGVVAAALLTALSLPWQAYTLPRWSGEQYFWDGAAIGMWALRWPLYGLLYGYFYPWLRGHSPLGKAMRLLAVVLPVELLPTLDYPVHTDADLAAQLLSTTGNALAIFLVLGLYWEARLVRVAGLRWGQIRNFRTMSALAVPTTTIIVAAITAFVTAFAGTWATDFVQPDNENRPPATSPSESPTPGRP
ncbi:hypothetical protein G5C51_34750, partial [Streptomyces sp. A7024]